MFQTETEKQNEPNSLELLNSALARIERMSKTEKFPESIDVSNLDEVRAGLHNELNSVVKDIIKAIKSIKMPTSIKVSNFPEEKEIKIPETVKVQNLSELGSVLSLIQKAMDTLVSKETVINVASPNVIVPEATQSAVVVPAPVVNVDAPIVNVDVSRIVNALDNLKFLSDRPNKALSVRLSDGRAFLKALKEVTDATQKTMYAFSSSAGMSVDEYRSAQGGLRIPQWDTADLVYTGSDITGVTFSRGGTTVATLALTYTGSNLTKVVQS